MTAKTATETRTAALKAARTRDSQDKRRRALAAIETLAAAGTTVTFAGVAKTAGVSTWLVYSDGIRQHVDAARRRQADHGPTVTAAPPVDAKHRATPAGLRADLALARDEIRRLRAGTDKLRARLRLQLGAEIEGPDRAQLIAVVDLEAVNRQLVAERVNRNSETDAARRRVSELEDELTAGRESLRRVMRTENRGR